MNREKIQSVMEGYFRKKVRTDPKIHNACLLVHSGKHGIHLNLAEGSTAGAPAHSDQPYFIASIGKLFTSVLVGILVERHMLFYNDPIVKYLDDDLLKGLHIYKGHNYTDRIQMRHLLNHTSGLHDYFEDKPRQGKPMLQMILDELSRFWTPREVVQWSKENLKSHFPPGEGFHYSDTGYHLLGLVIESVTSKPFHQALREYIFEPLGMKHSWLNQYSGPIGKPGHPVAGVFVGDTNIIHHKSLGIDYAGGGIISTSDDLLKFMKALVNHAIIRGETFERMKDWAGFFNLKFLGIDYGYGLMSLKTIPIVMPRRYRVWGNAGSTGSFMFYHPELDSYFIGSLNQFRYHRKGIMMMFKMIDVFLRASTP
jgi:D-alanyl-D-alanine carboxypeptidase